MNGFLRIFLLPLTVILVGGCQNTTKHQNSSVVEYLYPRSNQQEVTAGIPRLTLPLKVGIAFTPGQYRDNSGLTEAKKIELMNNVSKHFAALDFVKAIEIIPSAYLQPGGSFTNLDQVKRMFDIDVIALISYDQARFTDEGLASISYWTLVGAYIIPAEKNSTHTMLDAALYDIDSRKMLFRAPGTSTVKSNSTLVNLREQVREDSLEGFTLASENLVENLKLQLDLFKEKIKQSPEAYQVVKSEGYQGAGAGGWFLLLITGLLLVRRYLRL